MSLLFAQRIATRCRFLTPLGACLLAGWGGLTQAAELPRWELGAGLASLSVPDYRGSNERRQFVSPTPYIVYRGDTVKSDREGTRAQLWGADNVHLDIYIGGNLPVSSSRNQARAGMPGFKGSLDIGPALDIRLTESADERMLLKLRLPVSYGFTLGQSRQSLGWATAPTLNLYTRDTFGWAGWTGVAKTGPIFATGQRNRYFYDVAPEYATASRPAYEASGGYAGWQLALALSKRFDRIWVGAYMRYDDLNQVAFKDSPLMKVSNFWMAGLAVSYVLGESTERVKVE